LEAVARAWKALERFWKAKLWEFVPGSPAVSIMPATAYAPEAVRWIWKGWLARGK
jgi:hypothetical protein